MHLPSIFYHGHCPPFSSSPPPPPQHAYSSPPGAPPPSLSQNQYQPPPGLPPNSYPRYLSPPGPPPACTPLNHSQSSFQYFPGTPPPSQYNIYGSPASFSTANSNRNPNPSIATANVSPPEWSSTAATSEAFGLLSDATTEEYEAAETFCATNPISTRRFLQEGWSVEKARRLGWGAWGLELADGTEDAGGKFKGQIKNWGGDMQGRDRNPFRTKKVVKISTTGDCATVCLLSTLPVLPALPPTSTAGIREARHGTYFELRNIISMSDTIALGTACKPYPPWRLPGWNRLSAGLHLDDGHTFYADPDGGVQPPKSSPLYSLIPVGAGKPDEGRVRGKVFGCGIDLRTTGVFFTVDGMRLADSFMGLYPRGEEEVDVYAAVGISGEVAFEVNFGGEPFVWEVANSGGWGVGLELGLSAGDGVGVYEEGREAPPGYNE